MKLAIVHVAAQSVQHDPKLEARAKAHWPNNENYQRQWIRMIHILRAGSGWVLEGGKHNWHATQK